MAFEQEKDKTVLEREINMDNGNKIVAGLYSYNGSETKYGEKRISVNNDGNIRFSAIGRKSYVEMTKLLPIMKEMFGELKKINTKKV